LATKLISIMEQFPLLPFTDPERHRIISEIIRSHSANTADIREIALEGIALEGVRDVLDLGCGFGFMAGAVAPRISFRGRIIGVDACPENGPSFLEAVRANGREAEFLHRMIDCELPWPSSSFDLVIASYSMYFFPDIVPEIARVLRPEGVLVTITHSERSFARLCAAAGFELEDTPIFRLVRRFSVENGERILGRAFGNTRRVDFFNELLFERDQLESLLAYAQFKYPLFREVRSASAPLDAALCEALERRLQNAEPFRIEKDDAVFIAWSSRCR